MNGNYRCSYLGFDLNRHWLSPSAWGQPEILSVKTLVAELHEDPSVDLDFYVGKLRTSPCVHTLTALALQGSAISEKVFTKALVDCWFPHPEKCVVNTAAAVHPLVARVDLNQFFV